MPTPGEVISNVATRDKPYRFGTPRRTTHPPYFHLSFWYSEGHQADAIPPGSKGSLLVIDVTTYDEDPYYPISRNQLVNTINALRRLSQVHGIFFHTIVLNNIGRFKDKFPTNPIIDLGFAAYRGGEDPDKAIIWIAQQLFSACNPGTISKIYHLCVVIIPQNDVLDLAANMKGIMLKCSVDYTIRTNLGSLPNSPDGRLLIVNDRSEFTIAQPVSRSDYLHS
jgi:hypothetical protein